MFARLKKLFAKSASEVSEIAKPARSGNAFIKVHRASPKPRIKAHDERAPRHAETDQPAAPVIQSFDLPLRPIVEKFPDDLRAAVSTLPPADQTVGVAIEDLPGQLKRGSVRLTFGELRGLAPDFFASVPASFDRLFVTLPIGLILPKIKLVKPADQLEIAVPEDGGVSDFDLKSRSAAPEIPPEPPEPAELPPERKLTLPPAPAESEPPAANAEPVLRIAPSDARPLSMPSAAPAQDRPPTPVVRLAVAEIEDYLPGAAVTEVSRHGLGNRVIHLPVEILEPLILEEELTFAWSELLGWMQPAAPRSDSPEQRIALPRELIAPRYHDVTGKVPSVPDAVESENDSVLEIELDDFGSELPAPIIAKPGATVAPEPEKPEPEKAAPVTPQAPAEPAVDWRPAAVAKRIRSIAGVNGIVIASRDGLVVAAEADQEIDGGLFAAFLPDIVVRSTVYLTEMNLAAPRFMAIALDKQTLLLARGGELFMGALTQAGSDLSGEQLIEFALELEKHGSTL